VNKLWGIVFGLVNLGCGLLFIVAPFVDWWLPEGKSTHSADVDFLFYIILYITGFFFFLTEAILVVFLLLYPGQTAQRPARATGWPGALKPLQAVLHDSHRVEMAWTIIPAIILLYIAFAQIQTWAAVKYQSRMPEFGKEQEGKPAAPVQVDVSARQFEWRVRYPSYERAKKWFDPANMNNDEVQRDFRSFARTRQADDVDKLVNELHTWKGQPTVVYLHTTDVIHSFNIPVMRVKQDALPGKLIPVWFTAKEANTAWDETTKTFVHGKRFDGGKAVDDPAYAWDMPCAELCGWGHYRMIGRVYVHRTQEEFLKWLEKADTDAHARSGPR
jgi:cytochrome c oxidase subunit 2